MYQNRQKATTVLQLIGELQKRGAVSRSELAESLSLYTSTVSIRIRELIAQGLLRESGAGTSGARGGRRTVLIDADPEYGFFGGLYLRHRSVAAALFTLTLRECAWFSEPIEDDGPDGVADALRTAVRWIMGEAGKLPLRGVGAAVSSIVSGSGGIDPSSHFARALPDFAALLATEIPGVPIVEENDANLAALLDLNLLESPRANLVHLLVFESVPTVGSGIVVDGRLFRGSRGAAGELDEEAFPLEGEFGARLGKLISLSGRYLDPDALFVSGELSPATRDTLESAEREESGPFPVRLIDDPHWVEKGAALSAVHSHIKAITGDQT